MTIAITRSKLFGKLNPLLFKSIESATVFCKLRGNPYVEVAHWLHQLLAEQDSDLHRIVRHFELDSAQLAADVVRCLDRLPRGANAIQDFSDLIESAVERAWVFATLQFGASQVRSAYLLYGMLNTRGLCSALSGISAEFEKIDAVELARQLSVVVAGSPEEGLSASDGFSLSGEPGVAAGAIGVLPSGAEEALKRFTIDLTEKARRGELDSTTGRDEEIRQVVDILMRRRQNNPLLAGEAGVGKTAIVEGFALRIVKGDVPPAMRDVTLLCLDVGLLQAGASMKGEFENRLRQVVDEVERSPRPVVLFIDEVHTLVGAGGAAGTGDAANLLKPALARGSLRTIAATTWTEYKKYIEKDPALTRRFQLVQVAEPDEEKATAMLRNIAAMLEKHHRVRIEDEAIAAAVALSHRYIPSRQLPDKAVSLLDTACARVAIGQHATPAELEDCRRRIEVLQVERSILEREQRIGLNRNSRLAEIDQRLIEAGDGLQLLESRWQSERGLVAEIAAIESRLTAGDSATGQGVPPDLSEEMARLARLRGELAALQGVRPLAMPSVSDAVVASVVADWTGIPVGRMVKNEIDAVLNLADTLNRRVVGQRHALETIVRRIKTSRARLDNPDKPIGVFLLAGPSGVGKTETALALAEALYGGEQNLITINMSEYQEAHTVSSLKGAPPGYVGYGEGGVLTEAVRRRPYSVVLLDEIEKAHSDVHEVFFQVFDKGWMEDGEGRFIDFKNTVILLTSNVGSELIAGLCSDPGLTPEIDALIGALREPLLQKFPAAFLGRTVLVPYLPLADSTLLAIVALQLERIRRRIAENHGARFVWDDSLQEWIRARCTESESGGRMVDAILTHSVLPRISEELLRGMLDGRAVDAIRLSVGKDGVQVGFDYRQCEGQGGAAGE